MASCSSEPDGQVRYASPNAMSALHRMGVSDVVEGRRLSELGIDDAALDWALRAGCPVTEEVERRPDVIVLMQCTPLLEQDTVTGAMVLLRDVTDLRRLDRLLLSKDAAIREVHHRVKNNLQTISSLLRLQARRLEPGKGQEALREAERTGEVHRPRPRDLVARARRRGSLRRDRRVTGPDGGGLRRVGRSHRDPGDRRRG